MKSALYNAYQKLPQNLRIQLRKPFIAAKHALLWVEMHVLPSQIYLPIKYMRRTGEKLNLKQPVTFNDKINWLKIHDHNSVYHIMADKYRAREYVADKLGTDRHLIPLLGVWDTPDEIDLEALPERFVLKTNHDNGVIVCNDKHSFDFNAAKEKLKSKQRQSIYYVGREWSYRGIPKKIICEENIADPNTNAITDYKFFCFNGIPKLIQVDFNRFSNHRKNVYDTGWTYQPVRFNYPTDPSYIVPKPENLEAMIGISRKLSAGTTFLRVDLYTDDKNIYFGELTFYPVGGMGKFDPPEWNRMLGDMINLPK